MLSLIEYTIIIFSGIFAWIIDDGIANLLLKKKEKGAMFRFIGARWLKRKRAIKIAFLQFGIAFVLSYFLYDWLYALFSSAFLYLLPICLSGVGALYLYILLDLPYKLTWERCRLSVGLLIFGIFFFVVIALLS